MPRYFVKFADDAMRRQARPVLDTDLARYEPYYPAAAPDAARILIADLSEAERRAAEDRGAKVYEDIQFDVAAVGGPFEYRRPGWAYWDARTAAPRPRGTTVPRGRA